MLAKYSIYSGLMQRIVSFNQFSLLFSNHFLKYSCYSKYVGSRVFLIAGAKVWNSLPDDVTSAPSLSTFRRHLKTYLSQHCLILLVLTLI